MPWLSKSFHSYQKYHGTMGTGGRWPLFPNQLLCKCCASQTQRNGVAVDSCNDSKSEKIFCLIICELVEDDDHDDDDVHDLTGSERTAAKLSLCLSTVLTWNGSIDELIPICCPLPGFDFRCKSWISSIFAHPKIDSSHSSRLIFHSGSETFGFMKFGICRSEVAKRKMTLS